MENSNYWYLASYPKSGNTWCRLFISELIRISASEENITMKNLHSNEINLKQSIKTGTIISQKVWFDDQIGVDSAELTESEIDNIRPKVHNQIFPYTETLRYHKVHDAFSRPDNKYQNIISTKNCEGIVYIIRNPLDIIISMESFFGWSKSKCIKFLTNPDARLSNLFNKNTTQISQYIGSWEHHVQSWTNQDAVPLCIFRYEDFLKSPLEEFSKLAVFLKIPAKRISIQKAIENCSFKKLKEKENNSFFIENSTSGNPFFRFGVEGEGLKRLTNAQINIIKNSFKNTLLKFNYY